MAETALGFKKRFIGLGIRVKAVYGLAVRVRVSAFRLKFDAFMRRVGFGF